MFVFYVNIYIVLVQKKPKHLQSISNESLQLYPSMVSNDAVDRSDVPHVYQHCYFSIKFLIRLWQSVAISEKTEISLYKVSQTRSFKNNLKTPRNAASPSETVSAAAHPPGVSRC